MKKPRTLAALKAAPYVREVHDWRRRTGDQFEAFLDSAWLPPRALLDVPTIAWGDTVAEACRMLAEEQWPLLRDPATGAYVSATPERWEDWPWDRAVPRCVEGGDHRGWRWYGVAVACDTGAEVRRLTWDELAAFQAPPGQRACPSLPGEPFGIAGRVRAELRFERDA